MSPRAIRSLLWLAAFVTLPVVYFLPEGETAPTLRLAFLTALMSAVYIAEGAGPLLAAWLMAVAQLLGWCALLYLGARVVARLLASLSSSARSLLTLAMLVLLFGLSCMEIYATPLSSSRLRSNLFGIFE